MMAAITTLIVWQDPFMNWAPYAVYNPELWHWPVDWPWVSLSPTVEPFVVIGYVMFQFGPYFPAVWILRKVQAQAGSDSFVWRHPLVSLGGLIFVIGFLFDMVLELTLVPPVCTSTRRSSRSAPSSPAPPSSSRCCGNR